jgi:hypothetical protein
MVKETVKINRNFRLLSFYKQLLSGKKVSKQLFIDEYRIDERTFERDVAEIRNFLSDSFSNEELIYDREDNVYYLNGLSQSNLDKYDVLVICKILVENNYLPKDEVNELIKRLLSSINKHDLLDIIPVIQDDLIHYNSNDFMINLKILEDLLITLNRKKTIVVNMVDGNHIRINPKKIKLRDSKFILFGRSLEHLSEMIEINLSDIHDFKIIR